MDKGRRKGFTLIELLVVIAIIGLLATIVLVSLNTARVKARDTKRVADLRQIRLALELKYDANKSYLATGEVATTACTALPSSFLATWLPQVPVDPSTGSAYQYGVTATDYVVKTTMEDYRNNPLVINGVAGAPDTQGGCTATPSTSNPGSEYYVATK